MTADATVATDRQAISDGAGFVDGRAAPVPVGGGLTEPGDLLAPTLRRDPYGYYARLRELGPVTRRDHPDTWLLSRYRDVAAALTDVSRLSSSFRADAEHSLMELDGTLHRQLRRKLSTPLMAAEVAAQTPRIEQLARRLVGRARARGGLELMRDLARPLAALVVADVLGLEEGVVADLLRWADATVIATSECAEPDHRHAADRAIEDSYRFFTSHVANPKRLPPCPLRTMLVDGPPELRLTEPEAVETCRLLTVAGQVTSASLIGNAVWCLLQSPVVLAHVRAAPALLPRVIEETMRCESPVQIVARAATATVRIGGVSIPAGARILALIGAANRDRDAFADPDRFDVNRRGQHLALGIGPHRCPGGPLARVEARVALNVLLTKTVRLGAGQPPGAARFGAAPALRGLMELPLEVAWR